MKIIDALHTLRRWFNQYQVPVPRITLSWDDPSGYYQFEGEVRHQMQASQDYWFANQGGQNCHELMGVKIDVVQPHYCKCDVCIAMRDIERRHKTKPIKL